MFPPSFHLFLAPFPRSALVTWVQILGHWVAMGTITAKAEVRAFFLFLRCWISRTDSIPYSTGYSSHTFESIGQLAMNIMKISCWGSQLIRLSRSLSSFQGKLSRCTNFSYRRWSFFSNRRWRTWSFSFSLAVSSIDSGSSEISNCSNTSS